MNSIDVSIARSEAEWRKYRYMDAGVRECAGLLSRALIRSAVKRINCGVRNVFPVTERIRFKPSYDVNGRNIVVSLTSTPDRISYITPTILSLAAQTRKPDLIVLWLGKDEGYTKSIISGIRKTGILVRYRRDLGPNTKYHYAFREFGNDVVITVDDDIIYHREMVAQLYETHLRHPGAVIARRVHKMRFSVGAEPVSYKDWIWEYRGSCGPAHELFATGTGGVLYPPSVMALKCWENTDFLKVCPLADDIWLKFQELNNGIRVCAVPGAGFQKDCVNLRTLKTSLAAGNIDRGRNDAYISSCAEYFGMRDDLCERILGEK